ncbi:hypothetical protein PV646_40905 [Streptomyces sp. ID05-26A]|nr:hypothetical protein [Streptomyces sp. ID05-26A]
MSPHEATEIVIRTFQDNGCVVTSVVADPADAQQVLYGTVTRDGILIGSYYCADRVRQSGWRVVDANGEHIAIDGQPVELSHDGDAVYLLTLPPSSAKST